MARYTIEQRVFIVEHYLKNNESLAATVRNFHAKYGRNSVLTSSTVKRLIEKFRETGSVEDTKHTGRPKTSRSNVNIEAVRESIVENPGTSIRRLRQELQISRSSLQRILTKDLGLHAEGLSHENENSVSKKSSTKRRNDSMASDSSEVERTPKISKKLATTARKKKLVNSIPLDANGKPIFPIILGDFTVHSLGEVSDKSEYHTDELIYPVGYCSTRIYGSPKDPEKQCVYTCKVMDGGQAPRFEIVADTDLDVPLVSGSIDECHSMLLKLINSCLGTEVVNVKGRGADFFGLSHLTVHHLIQASPGVRKSKGYVWTKFEQVNSSMHPMPEEFEASLSYSALLRSISFSKSHQEKVREKEEESLRGVLL